MSSMDVNKENTLLFTADSTGFVYVWNVENYCTKGHEHGPPECEQLAVPIPNICIITLILR